MVNEWTSNDVPSVESLDLYAKRPDLDISGKHFGAAVAFGAMVKHLNTHYPKPENPERRADDDASRWRRAHSIVEAERDTARSERDEWKARAARAEQERENWRIIAINRAEAAEARTTPTVDDPALYVIRESDVAAVKVEKVGSQRTARDVSAGGPEQARQWVQDHLQRAAAYEAMARAFEANAEPADQVEQKAVELYEATDDSIWAWATAPVQVQDMYRRLAAHVLGQGDRHVDQ